MTYETYVTGGLCRRPRARDVLDGLTELLLYNPSDRPSTITMTAYFEQFAPQTLAPFELAAEANVVLVAPIATAAVRYIYGLRGLDEWGIQIHCAMHGVPGPISG